MFLRLILLISIEITMVTGSFANEKLPIRLFNATRFSNATHLASIRIDPLTTVYDQWNMYCDSSSCYNVPDEYNFIKSVNDSVAKFHSKKYIVLDFEKISVDTAKSKAQAYNDALLIRKLSGWVKQYYPEAKIGMYDYDYNSSFIQIRSELYYNGGFDFFAPTLYQRWGDYLTWEDNMKKAINNDQKINHNLPIYAYVSPYKSGVTQNGLIEEGEWRNEINAIATHDIKGVIIWVQGNQHGNLNPNNSWVSVLKDFG